MTGLGAFEEQMPYQNYQGPAIVNLVNLDLVWNTYQGPKISHLLNRLFEIDNRFFEMSVPKQETAILSKS